MKRLGVGHLVVAAMVLLWEVSCQIPPVSGASGSPDWVNSESPKYPRGTYLTGVGYGDDRRAAEDEAYAAVSKIFQANIKSKTQEWEEYLQSSGSGGGSKADDRVSRKIFMDQLTQVSTDKVLENVSIAEVWVDPESHRTYALAVVDRVHSAAVIRGRIEELDRQVHALFRPGPPNGPSDELERTGSRLQAVRDLHAAFKALLLREGLNTDLKIIRPDGRGVESSLSLTQVGQALGEALSGRFHVALELSGPYSEKIRPAILQGLTREGLLVIDQDPLESNEGRTIEDVLVRGQMGLESLHLQGRPFFRWSVQFALIDRSNGRVFGNVTRTGREGHLKAEEAEARAVRAAQRMVQEEVGPALANIIFGEE
jgi:hypothetical protein